MFIHKIIQLTMTKGKEVKIIEPGRGKLIMISGDRNSNLVAKNQTNWTYGIVEGRINPGGESPTHVQTRGKRDFMYLIKNLSLMLKEKVLLKAGTMINIPPQVIHSFKNHTDNIVRVLIIIEPAGMKKLFEEIGTEVFDTNIAKHSNSFNEEKKWLSEISKKYEVEIIV